MPGISSWPAPSRMVGQRHGQTAEEMMMKVMMKAMMVALIAAAIYPLCLLTSWEQERLMLLEISTPYMSIYFSCSCHVKLILCNPLTHWQTWVESCAWELWDRSERSCRLRCGLGLCCGLRLTCLSKLVKRKSETIDKAKHHKQNILYKILWANNTGVPSVKSPLF